jgi:hypothetical protein
MPGPDAADRPLPILTALADNRARAAELDQIVWAIIHDRDALRSTLRRIAVADLPAHETRRLAREAVRDSDRNEADRAARITA